MRFLKVFLALVLMLQLAAPFGISADDVNVNLLLQETQKRSEKSGEINFIWWIPEEYWRASLAQNPSTTPQQVDAIVSVFKPYVVVAVVEGKVDVSGNIAYNSEADIRSKLRLVDSQGNVYSPLADDGINVSTKSFLAMMKPMLANILGPMGQNMYFYTFVAKDKNGTDIADPRKEGAFSVRLGEKDFKWELPLSSLVPEKICPSCKRKLNGTYKYCPFDGTPLP
ncbi:MAG: hypothetical protein WC559_00205 [Candidatus Omnitrophota bacterium]